jgi:hypothetical protein
MTNHHDNRSLTELVGGLLSDITGLFRKEIELAKAETTEKLRSAVGGVEYLAFGLVLAMGAIGVILSALVTGLAAFFMSRGVLEPNAYLWSSAIIGILVGLGAWMLIARGLAVLRGSNLSLNRTAASLRRDASVLKEKR